MAEPQLTLKVTEITAEAKDAIVLEMRDPSGRDLPPFQPGAHIELYLTNGFIRHYSLCNDARERDRYRIGVGLAAESRGGSRHLHRDIRWGDTIKVSPPRNNFPIAEAAPRHEFIAGGIGITPILSMVQWCEANGKPWHLRYVTRSRQRAAFLEQLSAFGDRVTLHADDEKGALFDVADAVAGMPVDAHIYCCGPAPLMKAVEAAAAGRPAEQMHFEWFTPKEIASPARHDSFTVKLARTGLSVDIPPNRTILEVLEDHGVDVPYSCREGLCASCETRVLVGIPDHRDSVLTDAEKAANQTMMLCVSRALSETLELDL